MLLATRIGAKRLKPLMTNPSHPSARRLARAGTVAKPGTDAVQRPARDSLK